VKKAQVCGEDGVVIRESVGAVELLVGANDVYYTATDSITTRTR
jgi:hypothetical protein